MTSRPTILSDRHLDIFLSKRAHMLDVLRRIETGPLPLTACAGVQRDVEKLKLILAGKTKAP